MRLSDDAQQEMVDMTNEDIAELIAEICYMSKGDTENLCHINLGHLMAVQLLMERVVLSENDDSYTQEDMAAKILDYMDYMEVAEAELDSNEVPEEMVVENIEDIEMSRD